MMPHLPKDPVMPFRSSYRSHIDTGRPRPQSGIGERVFRLFMGAAVIGVVLWLIWYFSSLVVYLVIGILIAYILKPLVDRIQSLGVGRVMAVLITLVAVMGTIIMLATHMAPSAIRQLSDLSQQVTLSTVAQVASALETWLDRFLPIPEGTIMDTIGRAGDTLFQEERITATVGSLVSLFTDLFYAVLVIPFVTFFFMKDGTRIRHAAFRLVPNRYFEIAISITDKIESILGRYFRGLLLQCAAVAVVASVLLSFVGLRYSVAVGVFTGLANTIPYFGPTLGFVAGTLVGIAQTGDFSIVPDVLIAMALTQITDNVFFQPYIFSRVARTHPLVILFVVLVGAQLAGILGMLIAIPLATVIRVAVQQIVWSFRNYRTLQHD